MPEGDTIHATAKRLAPHLVDQPIVDLLGSSETVAAHRTRLRGATIGGVKAIGKHLLIDVGKRWTIRTHMGMTGRWDVYQKGQTWPTTPGKARVIVVVPAIEAVCFSAPYVDIGITQDIIDGLNRLGPDLLAEHVAVEAIARAVGAHAGPTIADTLLDQTVASGIGNVYKSETLFMEHIDPHAAPQQLTNDQLIALYARAVRLLRLNVDSPIRSTTGSSRRGQELWVYGRRGRPCRRCSTPIRSDVHGPLDRTTYWCPRCQPGLLVGSV